MRCRIMPGRYLIYIIADFNEMRRVFPGYQSRLPFPAGVSTSGSIPILIAADAAADASANWDQ
jgi:hypothetical protein